MADHSNAENRKCKNHRLFYRLALVCPVTIETEIPLAGKTAAGSLRKLQRLVYLMIGNRGQRCNYNM